MTARILRLPEVHAGYRIAREVIRAPQDHPASTFRLALDVLEHSPDWCDRELVRLARAAPQDHLCETLADAAALAHATDAHHELRRAQRRERWTIGIAAVLAALVALLIAHEAPAKVAAVVIQAEQEAGL